MFDCPPIPHGRYVKPHPLRNAEGAHFYHRKGECRADSDNAKKIFGNTNANQVSINKIAFLTRMVADSSRKIIVFPACGIKSIHHRYIIFLPERCADGVAAMTQPAAKVVIRE
jgi:hypothetical protein